MGSMGRRITVLLLAVAAVAIFTVAWVFQVTSCRDSSSATGGLSETDDGFRRSYRRSRHGGLRGFWESLRTREDAQMFLAFNSTTSRPIPTPHGPLLVPGSVYEALNIEDPPETATSEDLDESFDIVYMWVNGTEDTYAKNRAAYGGGGVGNRDRDSGEFRYSLRSLDLFMPWWKGNLYFVHQNIPCWMNRHHPRLKLVHHREFFMAQNETLPTFSSDAIEAQLHRIPGIRKHFALFNDDYFLGRMASPSDFLRDGKMVFWFENGVVQGGKKEHEAITSHFSWIAKVYNTRGMLDNWFEQHASEVDKREYSPRFLKHSPTMFDRDLVSYLWTQFKPELDQSIRFRFRNSDGVDFTSLHHHFCGWHPDCEFVAVPQEQASKEAVFYKVGPWKQEEYIAAVMQIMMDPPKFISLNDGQSGSKTSNQADFAFKVLLPRLYPSPSQWESSSGCVPEVASVPTDAVFYKQM